MESTPREVLDGWDAYYRCEPFGDERLAVAQMASMLSHLYAATLHSEKAIRGLDEYMPATWIHQPPPKEAPAVDDVEARLARRFG